MMICLTTTCPSLWVSTAMVASLIQSAYISTVGTTRADDPIRRHPLYDPRISVLLSSPPRIFPNQPRAVMPMPMTCGDTIGMVSRRLAHLHVGQFLANVMQSCAYKLENLRLWGCLCGCQASMPQDSLGISAIPSSTVLFKILLSLIPL